MTRVALITATASGSSPAADRLRTLLPALEEALEVELFVGPEEPSEFASRKAAPARSLDPKAFDQLLYFVENAPEHAFMLPMMRAIGGVAVLHDWKLGQLALAARPSLALAGFAGQLAAWREGGRKALFAHRREGVASMTERFPLNRSVVRQADAFIVPEVDWRRMILIERNAHTPITVIPWSRHASDEELAGSAPRFLESLQLLPAHRTNRKSLIRTAIDEADRARAERGS